MEPKVNKYGKNACACCGYFTIAEIKETCPVCFWEEDAFQETNIDDDGGPNSISLREARENFRNFGVKDLQFKQWARPPREDELV